MKPENLPTEAVRNIRLDKANLKHQVVQLQGLKSQMIRSGPNAGGDTFDRDLDTLNHDIARLQNEIYILQSHLNIYDRRNAQPAIFRALTKSWRQIYFPKQSITSDFPPEPPLLAEAISRLVTKPKIVERVLGSRAEQFGVHFKERGLRAAQTFYWMDTLKSCAPALRQLFRWAIVGDLIRRWLGS